MKFTQIPNINYVWGHLIIEELVRQGISHFFLSSGSRSTPLVVAVAENKKTKSFIHFDERGTAYYALGLTAATKKPAVIITTSGTAVANLLPAVVEASKKKLPLVLLTADRPPELRHTGANQTIEQMGIFGQFVRFQFDLPCPTLDIPPEVILTTMDQAVYRALHHLPGPVHINCMFREPLVPIKTRIPLTDYFKNLQNWLANERPYTQYVPVQKSLNSVNLNQIAHQINNIKHGIIVVGKLNSLQEKSAVLKLSEKINWPIFPDITSGLRLGSSPAQVIHYFDQILLSDDFAKKIKIDGILHLGGRMTSQRYYQYLDRIHPLNYLMVINHPLRNDPSHKITLRMETHIEKFCTTLIPLIPSRDNSLTKILKTASQQIKKTLDQVLLGQTTSSLSEPSVCRLISKYLPKDSGLFLANSLPIREMNMYASEEGEPVTVGANRGASGIDGTVASACGFTVGLNQPVTLLIGDLAMLHDLNSLSIVRTLSRPLVIVIFNNHGGGIFSFLSISQFPHVFEKYFGTPHNLSFSKAAQMFDLHYNQPKTQKEFIKFYQRALKQKSSAVIEIITNRQDNVELCRRLQAKIVTRLGKFFKKI